MKLIHEYLRQLSPELHAAAERESFLGAEQRALADATTLARIEADALARSKQFPTFWDRYNEVRRAYGLPPAPRPST